MGRKNLLRISRKENSKEKNLTKRHCVYGRLMPPRQPLRKEDVRNEFKKDLMHRAFRAFNAESVRFFLICRKAAV